ncbi:MAG TPA: hypothetical protein VLJ59_07205 [Mycobacteriales bacterium]|nr:hypothetical protein [Mycobacteriales bacterium]
MDLAPDGFGTDRADQPRSSNGFVFPRDVDIAARENSLTPQREADTAQLADRSRPRAMPPAAPASSVPAHATQPAGPPPSPPPAHSPAPMPAGAAVGAAMSGAASAQTSRRVEHDWFRPQIGSPAEHPLMQGLLLELPPRAAVLDKTWLEQWLEAARATLELIYARSDGPSAGH